MTTAMPTTISISLYRKLLPLIVAFSVIVCLPASAAGDLPIHLIRLPAGFHIDLYAQDVDNARSMALSPKGTLFLGTRTAGNVYALVDSDGDHKADRQYVIATGLNMPNGVAFRNGALYVAEVHRVIKFDRIEDDLQNPPAPTVINDSFPDNEWHGWKFIRFGPDGRKFLSQEKNFGHN